MVRHIIPTQQIFIMEGVDMTGKTEIAAALSKRFMAKPYKCTNEWNLQLDFFTAIVYTTEPLVQFLEQTGCSVIFDRFHISEQVYSKTYGRVTLPEMNTDHDERLAKMGAIIIYCYRDPKTWKRDMHNITDFSKYPLICDNYEYYLKQTKCHVIRLDVTDENLERQVNELQTKIIEHWAKINIK